MPVEVIDPEDPVIPAVSRVGGGRDGSVKYHPTCFIREQKIVKAVRDKALGRQRCGSREEGGGPSGCPEQPVDDKTTAVAPALEAATAARGACRAPWLRIVWVEHDGRCHFLGHHRWIRPRPCRHRGNNHCVEEWDHHVGRSLVYILGKSHV